MVRDDANRGTQNIVVSDPTVDKPSRTSVGMALAVAILLFRQYTQEPAHA